MNFKQFLIVNRKDNEGRTNLWPPIGDLCLIVFGTCYYWIETDATYILGLIPIIIGMICFGISYVKYKQSNDENAQRSRS